MKERGLNGLALTKHRLFCMGAMLLLAMCLTGCGKYVSSYKALALVRSNTSNSASLSFYSFEGRMVFKLKCRSEEQTIRAEAELESGSAVVCYDADGTEKEWFRANAGEKYDGNLEKLPVGTVRIIVETDGKCKNGDFRFKIE